MHALKDLACHACGCASPFAHAFGPYHMVNTWGATGYLCFGPMAQCVVHALKGLTCRAPVLLAHAEDTKNKKYYSMGPYHMVNTWGISGSNSTKAVCVHVTDGLALPRTSHCMSCGSSILAVVTTACVKRIAAAASEERRRREPARAILLE